MISKLSCPRILVAVGFLMLFLTCLQGWMMVAIIAAAGESQAALLQELRRLHNLGLTGGFLALGFGLTMIVIDLGEVAVRRIYRILLPSLLIAPLAFGDRVASIVFGAIPFGLQAAFYALQAISALGITAGLTLMLIALVRNKTS